MNAIYAAGIDRQQARLVKEALTVCTYPLDRLTANVTFQTVTEPPTPGHSDVMSTTNNGAGAFTVHIRRGVDVPGSSFVRLPARDVPIFFVESVVHEIGHVVQQTWAASTTAKAAIGAVLRRQPSPQAGTAADWAAGEWEDRIEEAAAELFKDGFCPPQWRVYDNRTNWTVLRADWDTLIAALQGA